MLARTLEPEAMDTPEEAEAYAAIDHGDVNRRLIADLLKLRPALEKTLDVCTGPADIPIELCRATLDARVVAVDCARHMLRIAHTRVAAARLTQRIRLQRADAKRLPFAMGSFTTVFCNGSLHHIPEPLVAAREMLRVAAPGGVLFIRDLLRPADEIQLRHLVARYATDPNPRHKALFEASLRASLTLEEARAMARTLHLPAETVQATSDRHWTLAAVVPSPVC